MNSSADLLKELRIDRSAPPPASRRGLWIALLVVAVIAVLALGAWLMFGR
ncbi:MAG: efflux RND transporter periplasmic adaptor subunit, partial [Pseudomonadota bacterium]|nr:efflux RND transporter periplasmic adaptor subunit [Pseudomonadota bacterium]